MTFRVWGGRVFERHKQSEEVDIVNQVIEDVPDLEGICIYLQE